MTTRRTLLTAALAGVPVGVTSTAAAQQRPSSPAPPAPSAAPLFAVEFRTGPAWVKDKPANEQQYFREHSANLNRLRKAGQLVVGARYADKGLMIFTAATADDVRREIDSDPSVEAGVFEYELHPFRVHFPGCLGQ
jgi:hypothetical protein